MARIIYCHPAKTKYAFHVFTDLDFWDARKILQDLASVRRNFGHSPPGNEFPTQVVLEVAPARVQEVLKRRIRRAIAAPPRHVVIEALLMEGVYEFDTSRYFPERWTRSQREHFLRFRLPTQHGLLSSPYNTYRLEWQGTRVRVVPVKRSTKHDPVIRTRREAKRHLMVPTCF
ncbi:hypothetical protein SAMN02746041_03317 [Desulfacinum hydrothermale DSM 13146]|uniref:Uncharacterized protein n=1 Tax=Desulfacinum hydrothermale DSM 13146 TaxID=1121390 RepID=A0A1W1XXU2_9BACT|nr:hypothetical protein [Desulfacinum hydrothermale]SMC28789.1 hypothetical protein SAMN02746041_03317 [Desulfacinum hydrothermale DSM 13146]